MSKAADNELRLEILGPLPEDVPLSDLAEIISQFEDAVRAEIEGAAETVEAPPLHDESVGEFRVAKPYLAHIDTGKPAVSLVGISTGSDRLHFAVASYAREAIGRIGRSIHQKDYKGINRTTWMALHEMSQVTKRRAWGLRVRRNDALGVPEGVVPEGGEIAAPPELPAVTGSTIIRARVVRAGGATPKAELRIPQKQGLLYVDVSESDAKFLGQRLYETVVLEGVANWDPESWEIREFRVTRVTEYRATRATDAFKALAEISGKAWKDVDASEFVNRIRGERS